MTVHLEIEFEWQDMLKLHVNYQRLYCLTYKVLFSCLCKWCLSLHCKRKHSFTAPWCFTLAGRQMQRLKRHLAFLRTTIVIHNCFELFLNKKKGLHPKPNKQTMLKAYCFFTKQRTGIERRLQRCFWVLSCSEETKWAFHSNFGTVSIKANLKRGSIEVGLHSVLFTFSQAHTKKSHSACFADGCTTSAWMSSVFSWTWSI